MATKLEKSRQMFKLWVPAMPETNPFPEFCIIYTVYNNRKDTCFTYARL